MLKYSLGLLLITSFQPSFADDNEAKLSFLNIAQANNLPLHSYEYDDEEYIFSEFEMQHYGSQALTFGRLFGANGPNLETLHLEVNATYFWLLNNKDLCRQSFHKDKEVIEVYTECIRGNDLLMTYPKKFNPRTYN